MLCRVNSHLSGSVFYLDGVCSEYAAMPVPIWHARMTGLNPGSESNLARALQHKQFCQAQSPRPSDNQSTTTIPKYSLNYSPVSSATMQQTWFRWNRRSMSWDYATQMRSFLKASHLAWTLSVECNDFISGMHLQADNDLTASSFDSSLSRIWTEVWSLPCQLTGTRKSPIRLVDGELPVNTLFRTTGYRDMFKGFRQASAHAHLSMMNQELVDFAHMHVWWS